VLLPLNAPREYLDRETLWNAIDEAETYKNARTARRIEFALSNELPLEPQINAAREHTIQNHVNEGMIVDFCTHDAGNGKPHVHLLLSTREPTPDGEFSATKNRDWDKRKNVNLWRKDWADRLNNEYERMGLPCVVSHESNEKRGIDCTPTSYVDKRKQS
jgi:hypothetical protein